MDLVERLAQRINLNEEPARTDAPPFIATVPPPEVDTVVTRLERAESHGSAGKTRTAEIVSVDWEALAEKGYLTPDKPHSLMAEEYRIIKRPLLRAAFAGLQPQGSREHMVLVTSARPAEGKTFTTLNLGLSISAEPDYHVLLVDTDSRQRGLSRALGLTDRKGLTDVVSNPRMNLADVIVRTDVPCLSIVPAGQSVKSPTELFASQRMRDVMDDMAYRYADRFILLDGPPILASSEPGVLAGYVGQVVMVTLAGETSKQAVSESLALLDARARVNFILNKVSLLSGSERFGYYGYYGAQ
jgi:exopolysaccharide/PEP-CTERM locus tyrosine autokinase